MLAFCKGKPKGLIRDPQDERDFPFKHVARSLLLTSGIEKPPPKASIIDLCSPVRNQGQLGSCSAFASVVGLREQLDNLHMRNPAVPLSPLFQYYTTRAKAPYVLTDDSGATIRDAMTALATYGVCPETEWPYDVREFASFPEGVNDNERFRIHAYYRVRGLQELKAAIAAKHGVVAGISVYSSFESEATMLTGTVPFPDPKREENNGGHAVFFVAYDDDARRVTFKNSWGTGIGIDGTGYFSLPYEYLDPAVGLFWDGWTATV